MGKIKSQLSKSILFALEKGVWVGTTLYDFAYYTHYYVNGNAIGADRYEFYQGIKRLRDQGFVKQIKDIDQHKVILELTEKGKYYLKIENALSKKEWDGKWRLIVFDIPESKRRLRNTLRQKLKEWGFIYWQKSLWASKKDIAGPLRDFIKDLNLEDWVLVVVTNDVGSTSLYTRN